MKKRFLIITICLAFLFICCFSINIEAADTDIAQKFAPILYFEREEECFPVNVEYHINNSYLRQVDKDQINDTFPTVEELSNYKTDDYYLDNILGLVNDDEIIIDYKTKNLGYTVYYRSYPENEEFPEIIQYWMFYAFNKGIMNQHEGDWEMVQVVLTGDTPTNVMYSQHYGGQKANWSQVERDGFNIKVYVSRGSHANYLRSYSGVLGASNDIVGDNGKILTLGDYNLIKLESQPWLDFGGRWGMYGATQEEGNIASILGQAGPHGPKYREDGVMWNNAIGWGNGLSPVNDNIFLLEIIIYNFVTIFIILTVITLCILLFLVVKRYNITGLGSRIISILYIDGFNAKSIGNILCIFGIIIAIFSLINPWYIISTDISISGYETHGMVDMMTVDGINGIQIQIPGLNGPIPIGSLMIPFSMLIGISLVFLIIASIGVSQTKKLGRKYITRGVKLLIPIVLIIIAIMFLDMIPYESIADTDSSIVNIGEVLETISGSPSDGQTVVAVPDVVGQIELNWGIGLGGLLLLIAGFILIISGFFEIYANTELFTTKTIDKLKKQKQESMKKQEVKLEIKSSKKENPEEDEKKFR